LDKYKNTYRIPSNRLEGYDYGVNGCYYVTICTKDRKHYFGEIVGTNDHPYQRNVNNNIETDNHPSLQRTHIGEMAERYWFDIPNHFPFVILDEFVLMPNHIHGILFFDKNDDVDNVETDDYPSPRQPDNFGRQSRNLGSVIRGFKSSLKRYANENNIDFAWQERFYDRILRNNDDVANVRRYIIDNPVNWDDDELNDAQHHRDG